MRVFRLFMLSVMLMTATLLRAELTPDHTYRIIIGTKSFFLQDANLNTGTNVVLWTDTRVPAQRWVLEEVTEGKYALRNVYTGYYLAYPGTAQAGKLIIQNVAAIKKTSGSWVLKPVEGVADTYYICPASNENLCIAIDQTAVDGIELKLADPTTLPVQTYARCRFVDDDGEVFTTFDAAVRDEMMLGFLNQYYKNATVGHVLGGGGWWGDAEMFEVILDAFETTGDKRYQDYFTELYKNFVQRNGNEWSYNSFNDDVTWMVLACIRAYKYFGDSEYLTVARRNFDMMYERALQPYGTLIWDQNQGNPLSTNSCINCPATIAACYLGQLSGDKGYYDKALSIYAAQRRLLYNNGQVYDSRAWTSSGGMSSDFNTWASTYNQGTMLGAALMLFDYTKNTQYRQDAEAIYQFTYKNLANNRNIIHVCQTITGDLCGFKGILMRYVRHYAEQLGHPEALDWLAKNAWHAYQNRMQIGSGERQRSVTWSAWLTKTAQNLQRVEKKDGADVNMNVTNDPFGASTAVSAAFNAHVNAQYQKDPSQPVAADVFDEIQWMQMANADERTDGGDAETTVCSRAGGYLAFRHVDFGAVGTDKLTARVKATVSGVRLKVYADSIASTQLVAQSEPLEQSWTNVVLPLQSSLRGVHTLYFVMSGTGSAAFRWFVAGTYDGSGISTPTTQPVRHTETYNLLGQPVDAATYQGIVIRDGKKFSKR